MNKPRIRWLVVVALVVGLAAAALYHINRTTSDVSREGLPFKSGKALAVRENQKVHLYYGSLNLKHLRAEAYDLKGAATPQLQADMILQALIKGPLASAQQTAPLLPEDLAVKAVHIDQTGVAYVDLAWPATARAESCAQLERLQVYALVNSLILNVDQIRRVQLLIDGQPAETLAGHVEISRALGADMMLIR